jgi:hypothetical protein
MGHGGEVDINMSPGFVSAPWRAARGPNREELAVSRDLVPDLESGSAHHASDRNPIHCWPILT